MANETIMQGLLESLLQRPSQQDQGAVLANLISQPNSSAALAAYMMPERMANIGSAARGLFGITEQLTPQESVQQLLINNPTMMNSSAGLSQLAQRAGAAGDQASALRFTVMAQQAAQAEAMAAQEQTKAQLEAAKTEQQNAQTIQGLEGMVASSALPEQRKTALLSAVRAGLFNGKVDKLVEATFPEESEKVKVVGNNIWDVEKGEWIVPPTAAAQSEKRGVPTGTDPDQYDPRSFGLFEQAITNATTDAERAAAYGLLLPKAADGFGWQTINGTLVEYPVAGTAMAKVRGEVAAANRARENAITRSTRAISDIDNILAGVASGKTTPGAGAAILGYIPGTPYWDQRVALDTLKANLGISALFDARETSPNGSSGFGQLTQRELDRLENILAPLSMAQTEQSFTANLVKVRDELNNIVKADRGAWDLDTYLGVPQSQQNATITTPSGRTYTIEQGD